MQRRPIFTRQCVWWRENKAFLSWSSWGHNSASQSPGTRQADTGHLFIKRQHKKKKLLSLAYEPRYSDLLELQWLLLEHGTYCPACGWNFLSSKWPFFPPKALHKTWVVISICVSHKQISVVSCSRPYLELFAKRSVPILHTSIIFMKRKSKHSGIKQ